FIARPELLRDIRGLEKGVVDPAVIDTQLRRHVAERGLELAADVELVLRRAGQPIARIVLPRDRIFGELRVEIRIAAVDLETLERPRDRFDLDPLDPRLCRIAYDDAAERNELRNLEVRI